jgi:hypothetical protein
LSSFQLLVRSQCDDLRIDLKELLVYPLTPVPYSIATPDGFLNKADKSKGDRFLNKDDDLIVVFFATSDNVFKFNCLIGSKNFSCFSKRSEMKSTLASAPNASAKITMVF